MFEQLVPDDKRTVFKALKTLIESPLGVHEFYNGDKSHPYMSSIAGSDYHGAPEQATADNTSLYLMLSELSLAMKDADDINYIWWEDFSDWQHFCDFCRDCQTRDGAATRSDVSESASSEEEAEPSPSASSEGESSDGEDENHESSKSTLPDGVDG